MTGPKLGRVTPQPNIAYWELSDKPPRSDVLHKLADALGVGIPELLSVNGRTMAVSKSTRSLSE